MNAKKRLLKAARTQKQKKQIERMSEAEAMEILQRLTEISDK